MYFGLLLQGSTPLPCSLFLLFALEIPQPAFTIIMFTLGPLSCSSLPLQNSSNLCPPCLPFPFTRTHVTIKCYTSLILLTQVATEMREPPRDIANN